MFMRIVVPLKVIAGSRHPGRSAGARPPIHVPDPPHSFCGRQPSGADRLPWSGHGSVRLPDHIASAHGQARDYVAAVANALTARGFQVTHEIRQGLLQFELPAAMRPGDLIVTSVQTRVGRGERLRRSSSSSEKASLCFGWSV